jgi:hypothetical protein
MEHYNSRMTLLPDRAYASIVYMEHGPVSSELAVRDVQQCGRWFLW